jgi:hypothetical protein
VTVRIVSKFSTNSQKQFHFRKRDETRENDILLIQSVISKDWTEHVTMATVDTTESDDTHAGSESATFGALLKRLAWWLLLPVRALAFWVATLLPLTYLPLLATGLPSADPSSFGGLLALNAVAFLVGHSYNQPS